MSPRHFLLIDPYLLIYPEDESIPLKQDVALRFVANLLQFSKLLDHPHYAIGISEDCREVIKHHPRSAFNSNFMNQIYEITSRKIGDIAKALDKQVLRRIRKGIDYKSALNEIDENIFVYEINRDTIVIHPIEYYDRLPTDMIRKQFLYMIGELTFARNQQIFPIAVFENITLLTAYYPQKPDWAKDVLDTYLYVNHLLDMPDMDPPPNEIEDHIPIESALSELLHVPTSSNYSSLQEIVEYIQRKHTDKFLISKELNDDMKKSPDKLRHSKNLEGAIESLRVWLRYYEERVSTQGEDSASIYANQMYQNNANYRITDASKTVKRNPKLEKERKIRYNGKEYKAFLHVKLSGTRVHFIPIPHNERYAILLGKISGHLPTARF